MTITPTNFAVHEFSEKEKAELVSALRDHMDGLPVQCSANVYKVFKAIAAPAKNGKLHSSIINTWAAWREQNTGIKPDVKPKHTAAAKSLTAYFLRIAKTEAQAFEIMPLIVANWHRLNPFLQSCVDLNQISGNINLILEQIRNGQPTRNNKQPKDSDLEAAAQRRFGNGKP